VRLKSSHIGPSCWYLCTLISLRGSRRVLSRFAAISLLAFPLAIFAQAKPAEASEGDEQKWILSHTYKVGDGLLLVSSVHQESPRLRQDGQDPGLLGTTTTSDIAVSVLAGAKPKEKVLRMRIRRVRHHVNKDGKETFIDSSNPTGVHPNNLCLQLKGLSFEASLENGKVRDIGGVERLVKKQAKLWSTQERGIHVWSEALKAILLEPTVYLPEEAVGIGDTWSVQRSLRHLGGFPLMHSLPHLMEDSTECEFVRVEQTNQGRIAILRITGKLGMFIKSGETRLNIDKESLVAQRITLDRARAVNLGGDKYWVTKVVTEVRFTKNDGT